MKSLMSVALIVSLLAPASVPPPARANCRSDFAGIAYCVEDGGATQLFVIDLTNPHIRLQTVMANDVLDVRPPDNQREQVSDMARRYRNEGVVLAINGDYFGADRGPEGPTVVQGQRLDSLVTVLTNPSHYRRTTLALSRTGAASIGYIDPRASFAPLVYREVIYNALSGGPIILHNDQPLPEALSCLIDRIPINTCRRQRQTAAGISADGTTLYLVVTTVRSTGDLARLLSEYGADTALKLDGGGSSQVWYRGQTLLDSDRGVADALLVFVDGRLRHDAQLPQQPPVVVVEAQARATIELDMQNTGFLDWTIDRGYGLHLIEGASLIDRTFERLLFDTQPGDVTRLYLQVNGASWPGVYESIWQMTSRTETFGDKVNLRVVVIPSGADDLRAEIQTLINRLGPAGSRRFEQNWPTTATRIRQMIDQWAKDHPQPFDICSGRDPC